MCALPISFGKKDMYAKFPRQMLRSRVVSEGVRTLWPLATSGMYVESEVAAMEQHSGPTIEASPEREAINDAVPMKAAALDMKRGARIAEKAPAYEGGKAPPAARTDEQWRVWLDKLRAACAVLYHRSEVVEVANRASVGDAIATGPEWVQAEVSAILAENYARFPEEPDLSDEALGDVQIEGAEKVMAGD